MTRDDIDRLLIIVPGVVLLWTPLLLVTGAELLFIAWAVLAAASLLLTLFAFWRNFAWTKPWVRATAVGWFVVTIAGAIADRSVLPLVAVSAVLLVGAWRVRIPPERLERAAAIEAVPPDSESPFAGNAHWRDDPELHAFAVRAGRLDHHELAFLAAAWRQPRGSALDRAHRAVRTALLDEDRRRAFDAIETEIRTWSQAAVGPWTWEWGAMTDIDRGDRRRAAIPALIDAAAALITRDAISHADRDALLEPWLATLAGPPVGARDGQLEDAAPA